jgi:predicted ATP-grasp superfamily ATP-dependent carboligase
VIAYSNTRRHHATFTRVCEEIRHVGSEDQLLADLDLLGRRTSARPVLVPCTDGKVLSVSKSRAALSEQFEIVLPEHDVIETFMDKGRFAAYAERAGFPVPRSRTVTTDDDFEAAVADFEFPLVIKPTYRSKLWTGHTSDKAFELPDEVTARAVWGRVRRWAEQFVVQEWVRGGAEELYSCNAYFSREGDLLVSFVARKLRQWPVDTGQSALGEEVRNDAVRDMAIALLQSVAYRGLGYVEIKRDAVDGRYRIIEPNVGRPTGRSAIAEGGGVALLYTMYCDAAGLALPPNREQRYTGVKWIHLRRDLQAAVTMRRRKELKVGDWFRSLRGKKVYAVWSWRDPMPFFVDIAEALAKLARRRSAE